MSTVRLNPDSRAVFDRSVLTPRCQPDAELCWWSLIGGRVWHEERHRYLPAGIYRRIVSTLRSRLPGLPPPTTDKRR